MVNRQKPKYQSKMHERVMNESYTEKLKTENCNSNPLSLGKVGTQTMIFITHDDIVAISSQTCQGHVK